MGKSRKTTKRKSPARKRKAPKRVLVRKTKPKKQRNPKKKNKKSKRSNPKTTSRKNRSSIRTRLSGNSTKIKVDSLIAGKNVTIIRKTTKFSPPIRVARGKSGPWSLKKVMGPSARNHYFKIGKSHKDLFYIRLQYSATINGKRVLSHFSIGVAKIKNVDQFTLYFNDTVEQFCSSLVGYSRNGFSNVRVTALIVQGYKK